MCQKRIINGKICEDTTCAEMRFEENNGQEYIISYDYDQIINEIRYRILGYKIDNFTSIHQSQSIDVEPNATNDNQIVKCNFQHIHNQQEYQNLAHKLLKLKAFG